MKLDHVAIAVKNLQDGLTSIGKVLGDTTPDIHDVPGEKVRVAMLHLGETRIEVLEPMGDDSPISKFLTERGNGIHHIALSVENIEKVVFDLKQKDVKIIGDKIRTGVYHRKAIFVHPKSTGGILIELLEEKD